jgi:hypothetical protein
MSATAANLTNAEYDERKRFLEDLRDLVRSEQEEIFRILKTFRVEFSENSNGVFFDVCKVPAEAFTKMKTFMEFCQKNRQEFVVREQEERKAQEALYGEA